MRHSTGMTWEEHQRFGNKLYGFEALSLGFMREQTELGPQLHDLLWEIRSELDEFVELDCADHTHNDRREIYIAGRYSPTLDEISFSYAWDTLTELKPMLLGSNPKGAVLKHIDACLKFIKKHDLCRIPANPKYLEQYQRLANPSSVQTN